MLVKLLKISDKSYLSLVILEKEIIFEENKHLYGSIV